MKLVGLDIGGFYDVAARDWDIDISDTGTGEMRILDGGVGSVAVRDRSERWIGGPQATLAPHGLGKGWGELGGSDRRIPIADCYAALISGGATTREAYAAAVESLSRHAEEAILTTPDLPSTDEAARSRILATVRGKFRHTRLLWRPVALFLDALRTGLIPPHEVGRSYIFLVHSQQGFEFQTLRLREDTENPGHFAPEREGYGLVVGAAYGLNELLRHITGEILGANPVLANEAFGRIELAPGILAGRIAPGSRHVIRHNNRNWIEIESPHKVRIPTGDDLALELFTMLETQPADRIFLATPIAPDLATQLLGSLAQAHHNVQQIPWTSLATGALHAGRLIEKGLPHYFDRIIPIGLAVYENDEPIFQDLVDRNATLPANKEYVSSPYRDLEWPGSKKDIEFYVLKGDQEVRHWKVSADEAPGRSMRVELGLRQTPGQSWAKLDLTSSEWDVLQRSPISLNWEGLNPLEETPEEVLTRLRRPPPTVPIRIVEPASVEFWNGSRKIPGILLHLIGGSASARDLAPLMARSMKQLTSRNGEVERVWPVGTDGDLPDELNPDDVNIFEHAISRISRSVIAAVERQKSLTSNDELRVLTWMFTRCPDEIQSIVVEALEADRFLEPHPLLAPAAARTVVVQGAGRCVTGEERIRRVLQVLVAVEPFEPGRAANNNTFNALAMILSRRREAPLALNKELVSKIAKIVAEELSSTADAVNAKSFQVRFNNALSALAGLFRFREVEPYALLRKSDSTAQQLAEDLEIILRKVQSARENIPNAETKVSIIQELGKLLEGMGDPNILRRIEAD